MKPGDTFTLIVLVAALFAGTQQACSPPPRPIPEASVDVQPDSVTVVAGTAVQLRVVASGPVTWTSSDTTIATVDSVGRVQTRKPGTVGITATLKE